MMKISIGIVSAIASLVSGKQNVNSYDNNFYILLSASKFYFNYRHSLNVVTVYKYLKERGISDD